MSTMYGSSTVRWPFLMGTMDLHLLHLLTSPELQYTEAEVILYATLNSREDNDPIDNEIITRRKFSTFLNVSCLY